MFARDDWSSGSSSVSVSAGAPAAETAVVADSAADATALHRV